LCGWIDNSLRAKGWSCGKGSDALLKGVAYQHPKILSQTYGVVVTPQKDGKVLIGYSWSIK
jgi:hypothetical protein